MNCPFLRRRPPSPSPRLLSLAKRSVRSARLASADLVGASHHSLLFLSAVPGVVGNEDAPGVGDNPDKPGVGGGENSPLRGPRYPPCSSSVLSCRWRNGVGGNDIGIVVPEKLVSLLEADDSVLSAPIGIETLKKYPRGRPSAVSSFSGGV